jgi:asparagine synthase (glutamine-hydrolysing)
LTLAPLALTRLERASGYLVDEELGAPPLPPPAAGRAREAFADAIRPALMRPPCVVSFSGGRDSSSVLAVATDLARREGLPDPIPVSVRFGGAGRTEESAWQERVVAHLQLRDWERVELTTEADFLGDLAQGVMTTHGPQWPPNTQLHVPICLRAPGGSVLTGVDGDDLFGWSWGEIRAALQAPGFVSERALLHAALAVAPYRLRRLGARRTMVRLTTWLRPEAQRAFEASIVEWLARSPTRWDRHVARYARQRGQRSAARAIDLLAADHGAVAHHPLLDRRFLATLARDGGRAGYGDRSATMQCLFSDLLPQDVLRRRTKAEFSAVFWGPRARAFAADWDGRGLDDELIDAEALRREWLSETPLFGSALPLQDAWLQAQRAIASD